MRLALAVLLPAALFAAPPDDEKVRQARAFIQANEPRVIEYQIELTEIPAPPFKEEVRAERYAQMLFERGLQDVRIDDEGNVIGTRAGRNDGPLLVMSAHLDTVFPAETDVKVRREGSVLKAPGIGDDSRGLAVLLGVLEALNEAQIQTDGPIVFVGTVGEEGLGDLRGVKHLFEDELKGKIDRFISIDGQGLRTTNVGVGSYRYRVTFKGPGGHSYGSFGMTNPIHALGRLIAKISDFQVPASPRTTFSVGRVFGGTSINSIAFEASAEVDMRSPDASLLEDLHQTFLAAAERALAEEKKRWNEHRELELVLDRVGLRPAGKTPEDSPVVQAVLAATKEVGGNATLGVGSTDSNVGMSLGIPSVTIGGGGTGKGAHSPAESFDTTDSWRGTERALLVAIALSSTNP